MTLSYHQLPLTPVSRLLLPSRMYRNQLAIQLVSFFFELVQRIFILKYKGFIMPVLTASIPLDDASVMGELAGDEQYRKIEIMLTP